MSEESSPDLKQPPRKSGNAVKLALLAGVLGLAIGAGLYAFSGLLGNVENETAKGGCAIDQTLRAKLDAAAHGHLAAFKATDRPVSVAELAFKDGSGTDRTLGDWKGKTVLFNLWATWCAPCRAEMPALDALQRDLGSDRFEVIPVSVDLGSDQKPRDFYSEVGMKHAGFFHDSELETLNVLKRQGLAFGLPATLLINGAGCVLGALNGPAEWASNDAKNLIRIAF